MTATVSTLGALAGMLRSHQAPSGAFPACPSFSQYPYSWLRDSSFIAHALDRAGDHAAAGDYHRWAARTIAAQAGRVQELIRQRAQGQTIEDSAFLPTRFALSGEALGDDWPNFQLDGYGQWLWSLGEHLKARGVTGLPDEFAPGVQVTLDYLRAFWNEPCYDCWEEFPYRWHTSTLASIFGGLGQMAAYFPELAELAAEVRAFTLEHAASGGQLSKFIGFPEVDASLLWTAVPFGLLELDDPVFTQTLAAIERDLLRGGVHRYARDTYYGGGSWVLLTAWLGWVYARQGRREDATRMLHWVRAQDGGGRPAGTDHRVPAESRVPALLAGALGAERPAPAVVPRHAPDSGSRGPRPLPHCWSALLTPTVTHQPYGIDDPYKRLPTERSPRDPQPGDRVQVGFQAPDAHDAWIELTHGGEVRRVTAQSLGPPLWTADLGVVETGEYQYRIGTGDGEAGPPFSFTVGQWFAVSSIVAAEPHERGLRLTCHADGRAAPAFITLSVSAPGVCRLSFSADEPDAPEGLPCTAEQSEGQMRLNGPEVSVQVDPGGLSVSALAPGGATARASLAFRWLEGGSGLAVIEGRFACGDQPLYGLGERFDGADRRGREYDVRVYEEYKEQGSRTYLPVPLVVSPDAWGVWLSADEPSVFDLRGPEGVIRLDKLPDAPQVMNLHLIVTDTPYGVTSAFVGMNGGLAVPPRWAFGPWMSSNDWNNQARTEEVVRRTVAEDIPATVLVLEAWSDEHTFYIFNDAEYTPKSGGEAFGAQDFTFGGRWPDPKGMIDECHEHGIRVVLWQIPVQKHVPEDHAQHHADEAYMLERGYGVHNADGSPYRCQGWWFTDGLVMDFTHPEAREWWFAKRTYLFDDLGIDGLKTDGGEHLWGRDLRLHDGRRGLEMFNAYPNSYVGAYHDFVQARTGGDGLTFSRAGFTGAGRYPAHWAGDENSTWSALKASIQAGVSAGLCGVSMWSWDIGGFSGDIPTVELYLRSVAFGAFCPVMQYHSEWNPASENRDRTPWNIAERHKDPRALEVYRRYARLRMALLEYIEAEAREMSAVGLPLMRSPGLVHPQQRTFLEQDPHSYLFGRDLLVCPVVEKGALAREVWLPPGEWTDLWSGATFGGERKLTVPAPLERIPVFVRADSDRQQRLLEIAATF